MVNQRLNPDDDIMGHSPIVQIVQNHLLFVLWKPRNGQLKKVTRNQGFMAHLICLICQRVRSVRPCGRPWESEVRGRSERLWESDWPPTAGRPWESDPQPDQAALPARGATGPRIGLSRPASRGRRIRLLRPLTSASHHKVMWSVKESNWSPTSDSHGLPQTDHMTLWWEAVGVWGADRPLMHTDWTLLGKAMHLAVKSVRWPWGSDSLTQCAWEADRPWEAESGRPCAWEAMLPWLAQTDHMTKCGRPKVGGRGRPCSPDWLR